MLAKILCFLLSTFLASEPHFVIDRGERDIFMNLTSCSKDTPHYCYSMNAEKSKFDPCVCRCLLNYPMYRNPDVFTGGRGEFTSKGKPGCVWHSNHRYGKCFDDILSVDDFGVDLLYLSFSCIQVSLY